MWKLSIKYYFILLFSLAWNSNIQVVNGYEYRLPKKFTFLTSFPNDFHEYSQQTFKKEKINEWVTIAAMTGLMIAYDEQLIVQAKRIGHRLNISEEDGTTEFFRIFDQPIRFPTDIGSYMYFIGDGLLHLGIAGGFYTYGKLSSDYRSIQTGSQILQAMASSGLLTQIIKHITGRVSPYRNYKSKEIYDGIEYDRPHDKWTPFPDQIEYHKHVSHYDAFPSGHMAVCMATVTVIAENYPEKTFIKPIGYTAMTLLGFQMMNNGVHWISDYPLSIAMGYYLGKIAVNNGRKKISNKEKINFSIQPLIDQNLSMKILINYSFL